MKTHRYSNEKMRERRVEIRETRTSALLTMVLRNFCLLGSETPVTQPQLPSGPLNQVRKEGLVGRMTEGSRETWTRVLGEASSLTNSRGEKRLSGQHLQLIEMTERKPPTTLKNQTFKGN